MRFSTPSKNDFLAPFGRPGVPKSRRIEFFGPFLAPPWILREPKNHQKSILNIKNHQKKHPGRSIFSTQFPRSLSDRSWAPFWSILDGFGRFLHDFSWILDALLQQNVQIQIVLCDPIQPPALLLSAFFLLYAAILFASCLSHSICHFPNLQKKSRTCREIQKSANGERIQERRHRTSINYLLLAECNHLHQSALQQKGGRRCSRR